MFSLPSPIPCGCAAVFDEVMKPFGIPRSDARALRGATRAKIRVLVLDDHDFVRRGLCAMINAEQDMAVCGAGAVTRFDAGALASLRPDVVLLDIARNERSGVPLLQTIKKVATGTRVVALAMYSRPTDVRLLASAGAADFVFAPDVAERVLVAIRRAVDGDASGDRERLLARSRSAGAPTPRRPGALIDFLPREREVMTMIGEGVPTETIAVRLRVPLRTVHAQIRKIKAKANVATGVALVRYCVEWLQRQKRRRNAGVRQ